MMKRRKHRVVVEVTASKSVSEKSAVAIMQQLLRGIDIGAKPVGYVNNADLYVDKLKAKVYATNWDAKLDQLEALARVIIDKITELRQEGSVS